MALICVFIPVFEGVDKAKTNTKSPPPAYHIHPPPRICERCKEPRRAFKSLRLLTAPPILVRSPSQGQVLYVPPICVFYRMDIPCM